jgi:hypothetical protein
MNIKNSVIALAIGIFAVSCGGSGNKPQQSGTASSETTQQATPAKGGGKGKMVAFGNDEATGSRYAEFLEITGLKGIGKPVGYKFRGLSHGDGVYSLDFLPEGDVKQQDIDDYALAVWDLCSKVTKAPLFKPLFNNNQFEDTPLKSCNDARAKNVPYNGYDGYLWYYTTSDRRIRTSFVAEKNISDEMVFEVKFEHRLLEK